MTTQNQPTNETQSRWVFDPYHTQVEFSVKHLGMMTVRGNFLDVAADGHIDPDHPEASSVDVTIQTASIHTNNPQRDNDLRASNFLKSTSIQRCTSKAQRSNRPVQTPTTQPET